MANLLTTVRTKTTVKSSAKSRIFRVADWQQWFRHHRLRILFSAGLVILSFGIRWYQLPHTLFFGFEQGRDAFRVHQILQLEDLPMVGPKTDIAGIFHGPWYYYLMTIPYLVGQGEPLVASAWLIFLSSLAVVGMYLLVRDMTESDWWGGWAGIMMAGSFEFITYSRWLSNVTPAIPLMMLTLLSLWWLKKTNQARWWLVAAAAAGLAAQFEIILSLWWLWLAISLLLIRWLPRLSWRDHLGALGLFSIWYLPLLAFNLVNNFISWSAVTGYAQAHAGDNIGLIDRVMTLWQQYRLICSQSLMPIDHWWLLLLGLIGWGLVRSWSSQRNRQVLGLCGAWLLMPLPVMLFPHSMSLYQLYIGLGLGLFPLMVVGMQSLWQQQRLGRVLVLLIASLWLAGVAKTGMLLQRNSQVFYRTIQDDLRLVDQRDLLEYINEDSVAQQFRLVAFTIPYFQPEGWLYLQQTWFPDRQPDDGAQVIYVIIEKHVASHFKEQWIADLAVTSLVETRHFGQLTVEKWVK